jgi:hypothetical protein
MSSRTRKDFPVPDAPKMRRTHGLDPSATRKSRQISSSAVRKLNVHVLSDANAERADKGVVEGAAIIPSYPQSWPSTVV